jgi:hypothetical protein
VSGGLSPLPALRTALALLNEIHQGLSNDDDGWLRQGLEEKVTLIAARAVIEYNGVLCVLECARFCVLRESTWGENVACFSCFWSPLQLLTVVLKVRP